MTFAAEAQNPASERFFLVRITPRKFIGTGTSIGGGQYTFNVGENLFVSSVTVNDANEPTWSYASGVLTVTSATNLASSSNIVTIDHDIFLTGAKVRYTSSVVGLPDAEWLPLIAQYPQFSQSMRNITEGVFSLGNTDIQLISSDRWGQSLLGENDSFCNAPVSVWVCINTSSSNRKIFDGTVAAINYSSGYFYLNVLDSFNKLKSSASFGSLSQVTNGQYQNAIVPFTLGKSSPMRVQNGWRHVRAEGNPSGGLKHLVDGYHGILVGPSNPDKTSTTSWVLGRCIGGVKKLNFGTIVGNTLYHIINTPVSVNYTEYNTIAHTSYSTPQTYYVIDYIFYIQLQNISDFNGEIGDYIPASYLPFSSTIDGGWVCGFGAGLNGSYNLAIAAQRYSYNLNLSEVTISNSTGAALSLPNNVIPSMSVWVEAGDSIDYDAKAFYESLSLVPFYTVKTGSCTRYLPFTLSETNTYTLNGQTVKRIDVSVPPSGEINISSSKIKFRFSPANEMTHADALKFIIKSAGMETNDSTFTQADSDLSAKVSLTLPVNNASSFQTYLSAAQLITSSTLGALRVNEDRQVEYKLFDNPTISSPDSVKNSLNMVYNDTKLSVEYQDIVTKVDFENDQLFGTQEMAATGAVSSVDFPKIKQLHRISNIKLFKHCLTDVSNIKAAVAGYLSAPTVEYSLTTSSEDLSSRIGDIVEINNSAVASSSETVRGVIVGLDQSGSKTTVKINEIRGVP